MKLKKIIFLGTFFTVLPASFAIFCSKRESKSPPVEECNLNPKLPGCKPPPDECLLNPTIPACLPFPPDKDIPDPCQNEPIPPDCKPPIQNPCVGQPCLADCPDRPPICNDLPPPSDEFQCAQGERVGTAPLNWRYNCFTGKRIEDLKQTRVCCRQQDLRYLNAGSEENGKRYNFTGSIFNESNLISVNFDFGILDNTSFKGVKMGGSSRFFNTSFRNSDFEDAQIGGMFINSDFTNAKFTNASLTGIVFDQALINETSFTGAKFSQGLFKGVKLRNAEFGSADTDLDSLTFQASNVGTTGVPTEFDGVTMKYKSYKNFLLIPDSTYGNVMIDKGNLTFDSDDSEIFIGNGNFSGAQSKNNGKIIFKKKLVPSGNINWPNEKIIQCENGCSGNYCPQSSINDSCKSQ